MPQDNDYDPTNDDDVASDHIDDDEPGPSKRKTTAAEGAKDDVCRIGPPPLCFTARKYGLIYIGWESGMGGCV